MFAQGEGWNVRLPIQHFAVLFALVGAWWLSRGLSFEQQLVAVVFVTAVLCWILEKLPAGIVAVSAALILVLGGALAPARLLASILDQAVILIASCLVLAKALERSGIANRIALCVLASRVATGSFSTILLAIGVVSSGMSLLMSNTAVAAMMLPVALMILDRLRDQVSHGGRTAMLLMVSWGASVAVGVLVGTPPNLIAAEYAAASGTPIGFLEWMTFAMPINIIMLLIAWAILAVRSRGASLDGSAVRALAAGEQSALGPWRLPERYVSGVALAALFAWSLPDLCAVAFGRATVEVEWLFRLLTPMHVGLVAALLVLGAPRAWRAMSLKEAAALDWNVLALFAGGIALGHAATDTGLSATLGATLLHSTGIGSPIGVLFVATTLAVLLSELASNTVSATIVVPLAASLANSLGLDPLPAILGAGLGASLGFMMPVSTPPNAIIYGTRLVPLREMITTGVMLDVLGIFVIVGVLALAFGVPLP